MIDIQKLQSVAMAYQIALDELTALCTALDAEIGDTGRPSLDLVQAGNLSKVLQRWDRLQSRESARAKLTPAERKAVGLD